jgi:16S rRNA (uracil1498-N3)-methyltransferase
VVADKKISGLKLIAALQDGSISLREALEGSEAERVYIAIGPEGDFTRDEVKAAVGRGFKLVNLGRNVLKSDTAGLFVLSAIEYEYSR